MIQRNKYTWNTPTSKKKVKYCYKCGGLLGIECFFKNRAKNDGLSTECKKCNRARFISPKGKETKSKSDRKWREKNKEYKKKKDREYQKKNRKRILIYQKEWKKQNKELFYAQIKDWLNRNKDRRAIISRKYNHKRRSILKDAGTFTYEQWIEKLKLFNYRCADCKKKTKLTIDHIKPLSKGGTNTIDNIQPMCLSCNSKKNNHYEED